MKFYCICDNIDTQIGMRLAGIEGVVVHEADEVKDTLQNIISKDDIGIVLVSQELVKLCPDVIYDIKLHTKFPLIVEIPDRHGQTDITRSITQYVEEAIGIKI